MPHVPPVIQQRLDRIARQWLPAQPPEAALGRPAESTSATRIPALDPRSWRALLTLVAIALAVVGWMYWQGRAQPTTVIPDQVLSSPSPSSSGSPAQGSVVVHVVGEVRSPGLVHLVAGSRVADALQAAGGATSAKAEGSVNLARLVVDGEQIQVSASGLASGAGSGGKVSLNSATAQEFEALPGVGPVLAQRIIDYRTEHGSFASIDQLDDVSGIGTALMGQLRAHVQM